MSEEDNVDDDWVAPPDKLWVCLACGKTAENRFGTEGVHSPGWDASCVLNSKLFFKSMLKYHEGTTVVEEIVGPLTSEESKKKLTPPKRRVTK